MWQELLSFSMNIYLDIDGVLLPHEERASNYADAFLQYVLTHYPDSTYWLTTHVQGDASVPIKRFGHFFMPETVELMKLIKPTRWDKTYMKTEAIDFTKPFLWFDDNLFAEERDALEKHGVLDNWIGVDLRKDPDMLSRFLESFPIPINTPQG